MDLTEPELDLAGRALLANLGDFVAVVSSESPESIAASLADALDEWTATMAAEFNNSEPFGAADREPCHDALAAALAAFLDATNRLRAEARPSLTTPVALFEALDDWLVRSAG